MPQRVHHPGHHRVHPAPIDPDPPAAPRVPINAQTWGSLSLLHWPVPVAAVQRLLPSGLIVDEREGRTWLGVVPFVMSGVRVPPLPDLGRRSTFPELNVRVYVHDLEGHRGVWFLGLWCTSPGFVASTRALGIPYHRAQGSVRSERSGELSYRFLRSGSGAADIAFSATVFAGKAGLAGKTARAGDTADASSGLEVWMTARWNMFAFRAGRLWRYPVHHEPWRLRTAAVDGLRTNAHERFGFSPPRIPPLVHLADPVHTLVSPPRACPAR